MSLQSMVRLPNGELVSRNMDIHQILAANREQAPKETAPKKIPQEEIPVFGLLSRTVIRSPMINYIFPARIRHKDKNDVLFIGEDFIHIKEILPDGHLQHIFTKSDFGSRIRAAKVFGKQITPVLDTPEPDIKMENDAEENLETEVPVSFPPQVLILSLESKKLLFLFADQEASGKLNFVQSSLPLPSQRSFPEEPGKNIAVDPKSRAIAVSACENSVIVFVAKPLKDFWPKGGHLTGEWEPPIMRERPFQVKGVILRMEFLYPGPGDDDQVILLIIHAKAGRISFACFDWTHSRGLADAQNTCNKPTFERGMSPSHLSSY
ncbi:hypothetical protein M501DRAFT_938234 [Patellaria atrata CBS 101060]|uniref:RSE1/DDB1/CPSF1 first beta-propeller domain-containing protein n=1 Tax=Patellaria atrata CBS 101060 TaxID=1346257 RepID=A0A9P4VLA9_9PEZI|nr:hypothetical protein M501DRAFT_938234 [Patellaria atrata CBS 101060]